MTSGEEKKVARLEARVKELEQALADYRERLANEYARAEAYDQAIMQVFAPSGSLEDLRHAIEQPDWMKHTPLAAQLAKSQEMEQYWRIEFERADRKWKELERKLAVSEAACAQMRTELGDIAHPLSCLQSEATRLGHSINGPMVIAIMDSPSWYQEKARAALALDAGKAYAERVQKMTELLKDAIEYAQHAPGCSGDLGYPCKCGFAEWQASYIEWEADNGE